jgi:hypothetical protein
MNADTEETSVTTEIMESIAIMALMVAAAWSTSFGFPLVLAFVVTACAMALPNQAVRARRIGWAVPSMASVADRTPGSESL